MINWINSWNSGNKINKYQLNFRIGKITLFEFSLLFSENKKKTVRFMLLNFGFEI